MAKVSVLGHQVAARDIIILLVFGCRLMQTVLRMAMGALVIYICEEHVCTGSSRGWILSAHAFGYCSTQVIGGVWADRAGGRKVVGMALALAGFSLALTPLASAMFGLWGIATMQVIMGVAMGPLFPASMQVLAKWLPPSERSFASTALDSGITIGSLVALPVSGFLGARFGWSFAMTAYGLAAVAYSAVWLCYAVESPDECPYCSSEEQAFISSSLSAGKKPSSAQPSGGFLKGLAYIRFWAIYLAHFAFNYSVYFVNSWAASYYLETFGLRPEVAGLHLTLPHAVNMGVKVLVSPLLAKAMKDAGVSDLGCRRTFSGIGFLVPALCLRLLPSAAGSANATTALFSVALGFLAFHPSGFKANYMDVTWASGGTVSGIGNTIASVASSVGPLVVSQVRASTGSWEPVFHSCAMVNLAAALIFCSLSSTTAVEVDEEKEEGRSECSVNEKGQRRSLLRVNGMLRVERIFSRRHAKDSPLRAGARRTVVRCHSLQNAGTLP